MSTAAAVPHVIPAKAGIQLPNDGACRLDAGLRRHDGWAGALQQ